MLLAIDSGNTNTVFAVFDGEKRVGEWRAATDSKRTADEHGVWLMQLLAAEKVDVASINQTIIATVVPEALFGLTGLCSKYFKAEPLVVGQPGVDIGIKIRLDDPSQVGADRLVNAVAAHERYGGPLIIVDFGTATTFDVIDEDGAYCGGVIAPGINLSLEALDAAAAKLPRISVERPQSVIGHHTVGAMQSGVYWGYVGLIEGLVGRITEEHGATLKVVATGGLAPLFSRATSAIEEIDPDMTLRGLERINRLNRGA